MHKTTYESPARDKDDIKKNQRTIYFFSTFFAWNFTFFRTRYARAKKSEISCSKSLEKVNCSLIFLYIILIYGGRLINRYYLLTKWLVVWPTTPLENSGGISMESEDPTEEEESRRARLLPSTIYLISFTVIFLL